MGCPSGIQYGIAGGGATEYSCSSGRELFQCGSDCVKLFIVNVSVETVNVEVSCQDISDAGLGEVCLRSGSISLQQQGVVNWIAKNGVTSGAENGTVINMAGSCGGGGNYIYTHTDGQLSARVTANISDVVSQREAIKGAVDTKCGGCVSHCGTVTYVLSDASTDVGPSEWQGGSVTFQAFGTGANGTNTARSNFNWQNGTLECRKGSVEYDSTNTPTLVDAVITGMIG